MSDPGARPPGPRPGAGRPVPPGSTARADADRQRVVGVVIIAVAVLIGAVLVFRGLSDTPGELGGPSADGVVVTTTTTEGRDAPPPTDAAQSTTLPAAPDPATVTVLVVNGSETAGLAASTSETLGGLGYTMAAPGNVDPVSTSSVYFAEGSEPAAVAVAAALGLPASSVKPLPTPSPVADLGGAVVVVVLGPDFGPTAGE